MRTRKEKEVQEENGEEVMEPKREGKGGRERKREKMSEEWKIKMAEYTKRKKLRIEKEERRNWERY